MSGHSCWVIVDGWRSNLAEGIFALVCMANYCDHIAISDGDGGHLN